MKVKLCKLTGTGDLVWVGGEGFGVRSVLVISDSTCDAIGQLANASYRKNDKEISKDNNLSSSNSMSRMA